MTGIHGRKGPSKERCEDTVNFKGGREEDNYHLRRWVMG